jgi:hypothetical protein
MADPVSEFVAWSDNAGEYADEQIVNLKQTALEDIDDLMNSPENRDVDLWGSFEVDEDLVVSDYEDAEPKTRDLNWVMGLGALAAASGIQFFLDNRDTTIIRPAAYRVQVMEPFSLNRRQLVTAGRRDVLRVSISRYQELQERVVREFNFLKNMNNSVLYSELQKIGALQSFDKYTADAVGYVSRMTNHPPGSPQFKEAVADLVNMESTGAQQRMNRRSIEALSVDRQTDGNENALMCWVLDPTSNHCPYCPANAGEVMTLAQWREVGLPGSDTCKGGDRCNCHLYAI